MSAYRINDRRSLSGFVASDNLYNNTSHQDRSRRPKSMVIEDTRKSISTNDWTQNLALSRQIYAQMPQIMAGASQLALYTVGNDWRPQFIGNDTAWGKEASEWLEFWLPTCDMRGGPYCYEVDLYLTVTSRIRDGDSLMLKTRDESGNPKIQVIPAHRIGSRSIWETDSEGYRIVRGGPFSGAKCYLGVIIDNQSRTLGYNILGGQQDGSEDLQAPQSACHLDYDPLYYDQLRGITRLLTGLNDCLDVWDVTHFLKRQAKQDSQLGIAIENESGTADSMSYIQPRATVEPDADAEKDDISIEYLEGNEIRYLKSGSGKILPIGSDRPHPNVTGFRKELLRACYQSMGWFIELTDPSQLSGAPTRMIQDQARASVKWQQRGIFNRAYWIILWGLSVAMERREITRNRDSRDWSRWRFLRPAPLSVDNGYEEQIVRERVAMGLGTRAEAYGLRSLDWQSEMRQGVDEVAAILEYAKSKNVPPSLVGLGAPQPQQPAQNRDKQDKEEKEDSSKDDEN